MASIPWQMVIRHGTDWLEVAIPDIFGQFFKGFLGISPENMAGNVVHKDLHVLDIQWDPEDLPLKWLLKMIQGFDKTIKPSGNLSQFANLKIAQS